MITVAITQAFYVVCTASFIAVSTRYEIQIVTVRNLSLIFYTQGQYCILNENSYLRDNF